MTKSEDLRNILLWERLDARERGCLRSRLFRSGTDGLCNQTGRWKRCCFLRQMLRVRVARDTTEQNTRVLLSNGHCARLRGFATSPVHGPHACLGVARPRRGSVRQKRVDLAAYNSFKAANDKSWKGGIAVLGLKEGGVDWALDKDNEKLVPPDMKAKVDAAKADIISGKITVHDYMSNNACK